MLRWLMYVPPYTSGGLFIIVILLYYIPFVDITYTDRYLHYNDLSPFMINISDKSLKPYNSYTF